LEFEILSIEQKDHRLGLGFPDVTKKIKGSEKKEGKIKEQKDNKKKDDEKKEEAEDNPPSSETTNDKEDK